VSSSMQRRAFLHECRKLRGARIATGMCMVRAHRAKLALS
jgi:hypothetical protein